MSAQLAGAGVMTPLAIMCPACGARPGRPCCNPRGYLVATHKQRAALWLRSLSGESDRNVIHAEITTPPQAAAERGRDARGATPESAARCSQLPPVSSDELVLF